MASQDHNAALLDLEPDTIIELFEIDLGEQDGVYRFHPGKNDTKDIMLSDENGVLQTYYPLPIESSGYEYNGDGKLPRPKLLFANPQGLLTDAIKRRNDLIGRPVVRKRIFLKFLDHENFPNNLNPFAIPDPQSRFADDVFKINKKVQENKVYIEYELISPLELEDINIPARIMVANYCPWIYRGIGCRYGKRSDFDTQSFIFPNGKFTKPNVFFEKENPDFVNKGPNLGVPIADENNKLFISAEGYNLNLMWQGDFDYASVTVQANGAATQSSVKTNGVANRLLISLLGDVDIISAGSGITIDVDSLAQDISSGEVITFDSGATFTLTVAASAADTQLTGDLSDDIESSETGTFNQTITVDAIPVGLTSGQIIYFNNQSFVLSENATASDTTLKGSLSGDVPDDFIGNVSQSLSVDAIPSSILKNRTIVFSSGATFRLTANASKNATSLTGYLSAALADDESGSLKYVPGDVVRIVNEVKNVSKIGVKSTQDYTSEMPDLFFVCTEEVATTKDPRNNREFWVQDACAKNLQACKCRYEKYGIYRNGLPFGGFPSIEQYKY